MTATAMAAMAATAIPAYGDYGYGYPSYGWNDDFYYPGTGYYVYSRDGSRHRWTDASAVTGNRAAIAATTA